MAGVNKVILLGNLGKDPEVRVFDGGSKKAMFSLATSDSFVDKAGEKKENVEWHNIIFWGKMADVVEKYLKKGSQVYVEGKIATRAYDDKDGHKRYITEIICSSLTMVGGKASEGNNATEQQTSDLQEDAPDDLPF